MESPKWKKRKNGYFYVKDDYKFIIWENERGYRFCMEELEWSEYGNSYRNSGISEYYKTMWEAKDRAFNILYPVKHHNKPVELNHSYRYTLPSHEADKIRLLQNLCTSEIKKTMQLYLPAYKSISAKTLSLNNVQIPKAEDRTKVDMIVEVIGTDKQRYQICVKFLFNDDLSAEEIKRIQDAGVQYITIDCKEMMAYEDMSQDDIHDFMQEYDRYGWIHAPLYDTYLKRKSTINT